MASICNLPLGLSMTRIAGRIEVTFLRARLLINNGIFHPKHSRLSTIHQIEKLQYCGARKGFVTDTMGAKAHGYPYNIFSWRHALLPLINETPYTFAATQGLLL